jgi:2'-5' RNA ligase
MERYFIGVAPSEALAGKLSAIQRRLHKPNLLLEPLEPHITLIHPNALYTMTADRFLPKAASIAKRILPIPIRLSDVGVFGGRVLHIRIDSTDLALLQEFLIRQLPPDTVKQHYDNRPYTPHITVAQTKRGKRLPAEVIRQFTAALKPLLPRTEHIGTLSVYEWQAPRRYAARHL